MEIDRETIKALSSDTRVEILKALYERRRTVSELSRKLGLAAPTVLEHVQKLERANLVVRRETGHKWIYYEITEKGRNVIKPKTPVYIILSFFAGIVFSLIGASKLLLISRRVYFEKAIKESPEVAEEVLKAPATSEAPLSQALRLERAVFGMPEKTFYSILLIAGILLILASIILLLKRKKELSESYFNL